MLKYSVIANVMVEKKNHVVNPFNYRRIQGYLINANGKSRGYLSLVSLNNETEKLDLDIDSIFSINSKMISEGKSTIIFKSSKQLEHIRSNYASDMMLSGLNESYVETKVFIKEADPKNLSLFITKFTEFVKFVKSNGKSSQLNQQSDIASNGRNKQNSTDVQKYNQILSKRTINDVDSEATQMFKRKIQMPKANIEKYNMTKSTQRLVVITKFISGYLSAKEIMDLSRLCKSVKSSMDSAKGSITISQNNYPLNTLLQILNRFRNIREFKIAKDVKITHTKEFFRKVNLKRLTCLDIAKCTKVNDVVINSYLERAINLESVSLPLNAINEKTLDLMINYFKKPLRSLELHYNLSIQNESDTSRTNGLITKFLIKNPNIEFLSIFSFKFDTIRELRMRRIILKNLEKLKVKYLILEDMDQFYILLDFLSHCLQLNDLRLDFVKINGKFMNANENEALRIANKLTRLKNIKRIVIGNYFNESLLSAYLTANTGKQPSMSEVKVKSNTVTDEIMAKFINTYSCVEHWDFSKFTHFEENCCNAFHSGHNALKTIKINLDDYQFKQLCKVIKEAELQCRIIRIITNK